MLQIIEICGFLKEVKEHCNYEWTFRKVPLGLNAD